MRINTLFLYSLILMLSSNLRVNAQSDFKHNVTQTLLIKNAMLIAKPSDAAVLQSLLIKNGIITNIGINITPPYDARIIDLDSMYVYSGFIDAMSHTGIKKEEERKDLPKPPSRGQANYEQSGITPQISALSKFSIKDASVGEMRRQGFTVSQVFPRGRMIAGQSIIVNLNEAEHEDKAIINNSKAMAASFTTANGVAPSTTIGVIAKYRDIYKNTELSISNNNAYKLNPSGIAKPIFSEELGAIEPVVKKEMPFYFNTPMSKDVFRAISLQKELGFKMILSEVKFLTPALDQIKSGNYSVLLSMSLPEEVKEDKKKDSVAFAKLTEEQKALETRKKTTYKEYLSQASILEKNNVPFSFSMIDAKTGDILKNIRRMVKAGLSEKSALQALTVQPASMLGLSFSHGTVEIGKVANMVIFEKSMFQEKSEIKYVIINGQIFDYSEKKKQENKEGDKSSMSIEGTWTYTVEVQGSQQIGKIYFEKEDNTYSGKVVDDSNTAVSNKINDFAKDGEKVTFTITFDMGQPTVISFDLTFSADAYSGTITIPEMGTFPISGSRTSPK